MATKPGLYANIQKKRERIAEGSGEKMRKVGTKGAPTKQAFIESAKTAKKKWKILNKILKWPAKETTIKKVVRLKKAKRNNAKALT